MLSISLKSTTSDPGSIEKLSLGDSLKNSFSDKKHIATTVANTGYYRAPKGCRRGSVDRLRSSFYGHAAARVSADYIPQKSEILNIPQSVAGLVFYPTSPLPSMISNLKFRPVRHEPHGKEWANVPGQNDHLGEPKPIADVIKEKNLPSDTRHCSALLVTVDLPAVPDLSLTEGEEKQAEHNEFVLLTMPTNNFDNTYATFPGGGVDEGLSPRASAIKEGYEETGFLCEAKEWVADKVKYPPASRRDWKPELIRYYRGTIVEGTPRAQGPEGWAVAFVKPDHLHKFLNNKMDQETAVSHLGADTIVGDWSPKTTPVSSPTTCPTII